MANSAVRYVVRWETAGPYDPETWATGVAPRTYTKQHAETEAHLFNRFAEWEGRPHRYSAEPARGQRGTR